MDENKQLDEETKTREKFWGKTKFHSDLWVLRFRSVELSLTIDENKLNN